MADYEIPSKDPSDEAQKASQERLRKVQEELEAFLKDKLLETDLFFICIRDHVTGVNAITGSGCPACAVLHVLSWAMDNQITHEDGKPFNLPMPIGIVKLGSLRELIEKIVDDTVGQQLSDEIDEDETKH